MSRPFAFYVLKVVRISGWILVPVVLSFIVSGFALGGWYGFDRAIGVEKAADIHTTFLWPFIVLFSIHTAAGTYLALRRWGWIGRRRRA